MGREVYIGIISVLIVFTILGLIIPLLIVNYKRKQEKYLREKIIMQNQFEQELLKTQLETQEETFYQISEELHDNIGQLLSSSKMLLNVARSELANVPNALNTAEEVLGKAIRDLRSMAKSLNKEWLNSFNVIDNLRSEANRINIVKTISVEVHSTAVLLPMAAQSQVVLFRIIQEALQNSIKHGNPKHINIRIACLESIAVMIQDDGVGFDTTTRKKGVGISNILSRAELYKGDVKLISAPGKGCMLSITFNKSELLLN